ncbi:MAG: BON domain-containing protein [Pseudomonadota bacterium]
MSRNAILVGGIAAFIVIALMCLRHGPAAIEADLSERAAQRLNDADLGWARVTMDGRDLRLSGLAPDAVAREQAADIVAALPGVRIVTNRVLTISERVAEQTAPDDAETPADGAPAMRRSTEGMDELEKLFADLSYGLRLARRDGRVTLEGTMPNDAMIETVVDLAGQRFGAEAVSASLQVRPGAPPNWLQAASASLALLEQVDPGRIAIANERIAVSGLTRTDALADRLRARVADGLPPGYVGEADVGVGANLAELLRSRPGRRRGLVKALG